MAMKLIIFFCLIFGLWTDIKSEETRDVEKYLGKEKITHLHFFFNEIPSGPNATVVQITPSNGTDDGNLPFGTVLVADEFLTDTNGPDAKIIGNALGFSVLAGKNQPGIVFSFDFAFTAGEFNGSSISMFSRNPIFETEREVAVVGGRGKFRFARGFARLKTITFNSSLVVVEYNVTVLHY